MGNSKSNSSSEKTLLLHNSLINSIQKNKFNIRYVLILVLLSCMEIVNLLNFSITMVCCVTEFNDFWVTVTPRLFIVCYFAAYFIGRASGAILVNITINFVSFLNLVNLFLALSIFSNFATLFNLAPVTWLQLNNNAFVIILIRFFMGFSSGNTVLIRMYIFRNFKDGLYTFCVVMGVVEYFFYATSPLFGNFMKYLLDGLVGLIPTLPDYFFYPFFDTFTFANLLIGVATFVLFLLSFFVFKSSEGFLVKHKRSESLVINGNSNRQTHTTSQKTLRISFGCAYSVLSWVVMFCLLIYNNFETFVSEKLKKILVFPFYGSLLLFLVPLVSIVIGYPAVYGVLYSIRKYRKKWWEKWTNTTGNRKLQRQRWLYVLLIFTVVCLIYAVSLIAFSYFQFNDVDFMIVLFTFAIVSSLVLPFVHSGVTYLFIQSLEHMFTTMNTNTLYGYSVFIESFGGIISTCIILSVDLSTTFIVGFVAQLIGIACFVIIVFVFSKTDRSVDLMKVDEIGDFTDDGMPFNSVLSLPSVDLLEMQFHLIGDNYPVFLDKKNRLVANTESVENIERSVYFHRNFQHKHIFRIKGHVKHPGKGEFYVIFEKIDPELKVCNLHQYLMKKRKSLTWNDKINMCMSLIEIISELHSASFCHGYLSIWNIIVLVGKKNDIKKYKLLYVGRVEEKYRVFKMDHGHQLKSQIYTEENDINCIGSFILELFEEKTHFESPYRYLLNKNRTVDIPYTAVKQNSVDEVQYTSQYRVKMWRGIQSILVECFKRHPIITPVQIVEELRKCKLVLRRSHVGGKWSDEKMIKDPKNLNLGATLLLEEDDDDDDEIESTSPNEIQGRGRRVTEEVIDLHRKSREEKEELEKSMRMNELANFSRKVESIIVTVQNSEKRTMLRVELEKYLRICKLYKKDSTIVANAKLKLKSLIIENTKDV